MNNYNVLLTEDITSVQKMMYNMITRLFSNITVKSVFNYEDAIQAVKSNSYELIFLDINLGRGRKSGVDVLKKIKEIKPEQNVYMITGYPVNEEDKEIIEENSLGILEKPFELKELTGIINSVINLTNT